MLKAYKVGLPNNEYLGGGIAVRGRIVTIKAYRNATGNGLTLSKNICESMLAGPVDLGFSLMVAQNLRKAGFTVKEAEFGGDSTESLVVAAAKQEIDAGNYKEAIYLLRFCGDRKRSVA
jgi:hypothetical protein